MQLWPRKKYGLITKLFKKSSEINSEKFKQQLIPVSNKIAILEVFLFFPATLADKRNQRLVHEHLFNHDFDSIANKIGSTPVFLDQSTALQYSRYLGEPHAILRAYVQDSAVAGINEELYLKSGYLSLRNIHGLLLPAEKGISYVVNPSFNIKY